MRYSSEFSEATTGHVPLSSIAQEQIYSARLNVTTVTFEIELLDLSYY